MIVQVVCDKLDASVTDERYAVRFEVDGSDIPTGAFKIEGEIAGPTTDIENPRSFVRWCLGVGDGVSA